ncbi:MAG: hypothetical protein AAF702_24905 [Chloroflexota bacterium]
MRSIYQQAIALDRLAVAVHAPLLAELVEAKAPLLAELVEAKAPLRQARGAAPLRLPVLHQLISCDVLF